MITRREALACLAAIPAVRTEWISVPELHSSPTKKDASESDQPGSLGWRKEIFRILEASREYFSPDFAVHFDYAGSKCEFAYDCLERTRNTIIRCAQSDDDDVPDIVACETEHWFKIIDAIEDQYRMINVSSVAGQKFKMFVYAGLAFWHMQLPEWAKDCLLVINFKSLSMTLEEAKGRNGILRNLSKA